jgi:carboxyl-terminal processing protease
MTPGVLPKNQGNRYYKLYEYVPVSDSTFHGSSLIRLLAMNSIPRRFPRYSLSLFLAVIVLFVGIGKARGFADPGNYEYNRARLLAYILRQDLETFHFSRRTFDRKLSEDAFGLYLKQLDAQKTFLLKEDVEKLRAYSDHIDDEMKSTNVELPDVAALILDKRAEHVRKMVSEILSKDFDFSLKESIETDPEKLGYCKTEQELRERWRKMLKLQVLNQYLNLLEEEQSPPEKDDKKAEKKKMSSEELQESAREKVMKSYETLFNRILHETEREHFDRFFTAVTHAFDPHTEYMPPTTKEDFDISMKGTLEGIGASLTEEDGNVKVAAIVPGGPAALQGQLHPEDLILKVAEGESEPVDLSYMGVREAVKLIRGKKGTTVRLFVKRPDGKRLIIPIVRDVVQLEDSFVKGTLLQDKSSGRSFGYIRIPAFYRDFDKTKNGGDGRNVTEDVAKELKTFVTRHISGLIIDLRNNGGGALTDAVQIAGLFIKTGPVVQVKDGNGKITVLSDDDPDIAYSGPLVILVNKFSASASEILAGALQDYGRAVIIGGEHTHGKGTVQSLVDLNGDIPFANMGKYRTLGALKVTIQKFYRVSGESTQYRGVQPDIILPDTLDGIKSGEKYLDFALPWDTVEAVPYKKLPLLSREIRELKNRSSRRVKSSKDFVEISSAGRKAEELRKKTLVSLNIDDARKERQEMKNIEKGESPFHGLSASDKKTSGMTSAERKEFWVKEVNGDAYVGEAESVLDDVITLTPALSAN